MKERIGQKIKLTSYEELLGVGNEESAVDVSIKDIHSFENHPFKVLDDDKMQELIESIKKNGVLTPVLLRSSKKKRGYEMISGHRRLHAAELAGLTVIPAIVREMDDDTAILAMVDANIQREELLPSEKAHAYKMKMDAIKRQGTRSDLTCAQNDHKLGVKSRNIIGEQLGISSAQVSRYIRLTELIPELLELVDKKRLQFTVAVEISYISKDIQVWINEYIHENGCVKQNQIALLRQELTNGTRMTQNQMISLFHGTAVGRIPKKKVTLSENKLYEYFPPHYTSSQMERVIVQLLTQWKESQGGDESVF